MKNVGWEIRPIGWFVITLTAVCILVFLVKRWKKSKFDDKGPHYVPGG